jgi:hypothetical protein
MKIKTAGRPVVRILLSQCFSDPKVQRGLKSKHVAAGVGENHVPAAIRNIVVSKRKGVSAKSDRLYSILDGNHRVNMARQEKYTYIYAEVHEGMTIEEEAAMFELLNRTYAASAADKFRVAMVKADSLETKVFTIVSQAGCMLKLYDGDNHPNLITCISPLLTAAKDKLPDHLRNMMTVLMAVFATDGLLQTKAKSSRFLEGLSLAVYEGAKRGMNVDQIIEAFKGLMAFEVINKAHELAQGNGFKEIDSVYRVLAERLNRRKKLKIAA